MRAQQAGAAGWSGIPPGRNIMIQQLILNLKAARCDYDQLRELRPAASSSLVLYRSRGELLLAV